MGPLLVTALLAAATPLKLASTGLHVVGLEPKLGEFLSEHLAQQMKLAGLGVVTQREMQSLLGLERQRALLGCNEQAGACMAELASALGADGVVLGDVAKVGGRTQVDLKVIASGDGRTLAVFSETVATDEAVLEALGRGARHLATETSAALGRALAPSATPRTSSRPPARAWALVPLGLSLAGGVLGTVLVLGASDSQRQLYAATPRTELEGMQVKQSGQQQQLWAAVSFAAAGALLVTAVVLFVLGFSG